jgi:hypothetical protein
MPDTGKMPGIGPKQAKYAENSHGSLRVAPDRLKIIIIGIDPIYQCSQKKIFREKFKVNQRNQHVKMSIPGRV